MGVRLKRMVAFWLDWLVIGFVGILAIFLLLLAAYLLGASEPLIFASIMMLAVLGVFAVFILRDILFRGRSLGKRLFDLRIFDKQTLLEASASQRGVRNLFSFFLYPLDGIVLLVTGETIGDRVAGTIVCSRESYQAYYAQRSLGQEPTQARKNGRSPIAVIAIVIACFVAFFGLMQILLSAQKDTEEYYLAYNYLISSEAYAELDAREADVRLLSYSFQQVGNTGGAGASETLQYGFFVKGKSLVVVCHREQGGWQVCPECTPFD